MSSSSQRITTFDSSPLKPRIDEKKMRLPCLSRFVDQSVACPAASALPPSSRTHATRARRRPAAAPPPCRRGGSITAGDRAAWSSAWISSDRRALRARAPRASTSPRYFFITSRWIACVLRQLTVRSNSAELARHVEPRLVDLLVGVHEQPHECVALVSQRRHQRGQPVVVEVLGLVDHERVVDRRRARWSRPASSSGTTFVPELL